MFLSIRLTQETQESWVYRIGQDAFEIYSQEKCLLKTVRE
jgi:hypothetical protein